MRYYKHKGLKLPSVTTILADCSNPSQALIQWSANLAAECVIDFMFGDVEKVETTAELINIARFKHKEVSKQALEVGSAVHDSIKTYLTIGKEPRQPNSFSSDMMQENLNAFNAFLQFEKDYELEMIRGEFKIYSDYGWAGTADLEGMITVKGERKKYLLDWKTSKRLYKEVRVQTAAYRSMTKCTHNGAVRLDKKTGKYEFKDYSRFYEKDLKEWHSTVRLYFDRHPIIAREAGV